MLKEKKDPGAFLFPIRLINESALADTGSDTNTMPYRIYEQLGRDDIMQEERNITMINYTETEVTSRLVNVLCQVGLTTLSAQFLILEIPIDRDATIVVGRGFLDTIGGNIDIPNRILTTFDGLTRAYDHEAGSSRAKRSRNVETVEEALIPYVHHEFLEWGGCSREAKSRYNTRYMLKISLKEAETGEEIFFSVAWFDKVCADDELQSKKIISFRLGGRAHGLTLLEFARRLGLYQADELEKEGFDTYFQGGLRSDENFNAREYWERISIDRDLHLSRSSITFVRFPILRVLHKMITYGLCHRTTGYEKIQRNDLWKSRVLTEDIARTLSTPVYCRDLDRTTLRELTDSDDRLIPDIPVDDVRRVAAQRALRGDYNLPGYAQPQYDQYYQQYYPQQPPQQQHDDEENEYLDM
ncbi:putative reverse transcriptase, RNA-dependent DNA polymerase [Tanacetum coccineum]